MVATHVDTRPTIYPCVFYRDAPAAIEFLSRAFGFETLMLVPGEQPGTVEHSELRLDTGVIMVGTGSVEKGWVSPQDAAGLTQLLYIYVDDVDAHCERARAAGAEIVLEPSDKDYGGRDYLARDPEGHAWSFGTYRPES